MGDESGSRKEHKTRAYCSKSAPSTWLSIHSQRSKKQTASWKAGYRSAKVQNRHLRPRLLLAPTSKLQIRNDSKIQSRVLECQIQAERGARPDQSKDSEETGLATAHPVGMRVEGLGKNHRQNYRSAPANDRFQFARGTGGPGTRRGDQSDIRQEKVGAGLSRPFIS